MKRIIICLNTLAILDPVSKVASIGMTWYDVDEGQVDFKELKRRGIHLPLKFNEQVGRTEDKMTMDFWLNQEVAARSFLDAEYPYTVSDAYNRIDAWTHHYGLRDANMFFVSPQDSQYASLFGMSINDVRRVRNIPTMLDTFMPDWKDTARELTEELPMTSHHAQHDACLFALLMSSSREHLLTVKAPAMAHMALVTGNAVELVEDLAW